MNFVEMLFGIAPDGGNGWIEFAVITLLAGVLFFLNRRRKAPKERSA